MKSAIGLMLVAASAGLVAAHGDGHDYGYGGDHHDTASYETSTGYDDSYETPSTYESSSPTSYETTASESYSSSEPEETETGAATSYEPPVTSEEPAAPECPPSYVTVSVGDGVECAPPETTVSAPPPESTSDSEPESPPPVEVSVGTRCTHGAAAFALVAGVAMLLGTM